MKRKLIFLAAIIGLIAAMTSAYLFGLSPKPQKPIFNPSVNPYDKGIYSNGIIESYQANGANTNLYLEVPGSVEEVLVSEGDLIKKGTPLLKLDDSVQRKVMEEQKESAAAALSILQKLKAEPRPENLDVSIAQLEVAKANKKLAQDQYDKQKRSNDLRPGSVSLESLDNSRNSLNVAFENLRLAENQYLLVKAGAWSYDIISQEKQFKAQSAAAKASEALLAKFTLLAPYDGIVLAVNASKGSFVTTQGIYDTYTGGNKPVLVIGTSPEKLAVRCYIDEILLQRLPSSGNIRAEMTIRGSNLHIPLNFVRIQPYVTPKIQLSDQRQERVDVRVLPMIFSFTNPPEKMLYPGQLVDVYIADRP